VAPGARLAAGTAVYPERMRASPGSRRAIVDWSALLSQHVQALLSY